MKYIYAALLSVMMFFFISDSAAAIPVSEYMESINPYDITVFTDDPNFYANVYPIPFLYASGGRYEKEEEMDVTTMYYRLYHRGSLVAHSSLSFGYILETNADLNMEGYIENGGNPLFSQPGTLSLDVEVRGSSARLVVYRSDGTSYGESLNCGTAATTTHYVTFDNSNADIIKIALFVEPYLTSSQANQYVVGGFFDYGYVFTEPVPPDEPEDPPVVISGDLNGTISYMINLIVSMVNVFFILEIIPGVTFGYFVLACMIMSIVFSFFFHRMIK